MVDPDRPPPDPEDFDTLLAEAQRAVGEYFDTLQRFPERGTIEIADQRYTLVRAGSLSVEFMDVVRGIYGTDDQEHATAIARGLLYDVAHAMGLSDARVFAQRMNLEHPMEKLSAGPIHFAHAGWASVELLPGGSPTPDEDYFLIYDHPYSFESDAWLDAGRNTQLPVCSMNAGYSSGWCESSFGLPLVSVELLCRARGDDRCHFVMAPPSRIRDRITTYLEQHPELKQSVGRYEIPDFLSRQEAQVALQQSEANLRQANAILEEKVRVRTKALSDLNNKLQEELTLRQQGERERRRMERTMLENQHLESLAVMAGGVAHDFNNLLAGILGQAEMLSLAITREDESSVLQTRVDMIQKAAVRASELTEQLLTYAGRGQLLSEVVDLSTSLEETVQLLRATVPRTIELELSLDRNLPNVLVDRGQLQQVVMNLVLNAAESMDEDSGKIAIQSSQVELDVEALATCRFGSETKPGSYVCLTIEDNGHGIHESLFDKIFEPFFTTKFTGRGLGLATLQGIIVAHGGALRLSSTPGDGTRFEVFLPPVSVDESTPSAKPSVSGSLQGLRALVVDDEADVRLLAIEMLDVLGVTSTACIHGGEALEAVRRGVANFDFALLDVTMPVMGGEETLAAIREHLPNLPVVLMSGYGLVEPTQTNDPRTFFIQKPFTMQILSDALRHVTSSKPV